MPQKPAASSSYIPGLDGLRALSVLCVIAGHAGVPKAPADLGVTVFFFVSGYLITGLLLSEQAANGQVSISRFYARRYLRLMPELLLYALISLLFLLIMGNGPRIIDVIAALFYFTNYRLALNPIEAQTIFRYGHFWSLAVEEHFYVTWPLLIFAARGRLRPLLLIVSVSIVGPLVLRIIDIRSPIGESYVRIASECRFDSIGYGALLAILMRLHPETITPLVTRPITTVLGGAALLTGFTYGALIGLRGQVHDVLVFCGQGMGLFLIFVWLYASDTSKGVLRFLERAPMRAIGRWSYGIYIWQSAAVFGIARLFHTLTPDTLSPRQSIMVAVLATPLSIGLGALSWKIALQPVNIWRKRMGAHIFAARA